MSVNAILMNQETLIAPEFSTSNSYEVGDYVKYGNRIYRFSRSKTAGAWDGGYVEEVSAVGQYVTAGKLSGTTLGRKATAEGSHTTASGQNSHAEGSGTVASGDYSHAEGSDTTASGEYSHAEGYDTTASGGDSHAEGSNTVASGNCSHAEGSVTTASGDYSHAEGLGEQTTEGLTSTDNDKIYSTTSTENLKIGRALSYNGITAVITAIDQTSSPNTITLDKTLGQINNKVVTIGGASGNYSHAEGHSTTASGYASHAEGGDTTASGYASHAEGDSSEAVGQASHAEGDSTTASGNYSHAEGHVTTASKLGSHAEGEGTTASGNYSHAEGRSTTASGANSHAEGFITEAKGNHSHAEGYRTTANKQSQHVFGEYNLEDSSTDNYRNGYVEIVGNGTSSSRSNARTLDWNGNEWLAGNLTIGGANGITLSIDSSGNLKVTKGNKSATITLS